MKRRHIIQTVVALTCLGLIILVFMNKKATNKEESSVISRETTVTDSISYISHGKIIYVNKDSSNSVMPSYVPDGGFVPDEKTATQMAMVIWSAIYGEEQIRSEFPFHIALMDDTLWVIDATVNSKGTTGSAAHLELRKSDGKVLSVGHGR